METTEVTSKPGKQVVKTTTVDGSDTSSDQRLIVIDFGKKQGKKKIRRLRQGQGPLLDDVKDIVARTKENLGVKENVLPIVIVVEKKRNNRVLW